MLCLKLVKEAINPIKYTTVRVDGGMPLIPVPVKYFSLFFNNEAC